MAIRAISGYRTVSHAAATLLAGMPPLELVAAAYAEAYRRTRELRDQGIPVTAGTRRLLGLQAKRATREEWRVWLTEPSISGKRTDRVRAGRAVPPLWRQWGSAQHTLEVCPEWADQRRVLTDKIGRDLTPRAVVEAVIDEEENWDAFSSFCEHVLQKEEAERIRRGEANPPGLETLGSPAPNRHPGGAAGGLVAPPPHIQRKEEKGPYQGQAGV
ncbi:PREDICTED: uncharacterized protein LOC105556892 [Vollenhovia emeryi]|uniref:uncharacterized protein LOC105556892 n=1 Tax=Vollenhovia emeryi TaxID=411798 RepID=UPI0005F53A38|nr:PREDICTED: uncharacterized protein LOC105556892 [Vollenhovia emeryi]